MNFFHYNEEKMDGLAWCGLLFQAAMEKPETAAGVRAGEFSVFPNQCRGDWEERRLFDLKSIRRDPGIPEILKEVCDVLDRQEG